MQLAEELGVSQGTVRKALDEMTADNLLVRRQGRGTYVAEHDQEHALFHFFKLTDRHGRALVPESRVLRFARGLARAAEVERLGLARSEEHTSELQSLMRSSYAVFCLKKKKTNTIKHKYQQCQDTS